MNRYTRSMFFVRAAVSSGLLLAKGLRGQVPSARWRRSMKVGDRATAPNNVTPALSLFVSAT